MATTLKLYLLTQNLNDTYDTFDSVVVCAKSEADAKTIHPDGGVFVEIEGRINPEYSHGDWVSKFSHIQSKYLGPAAECIERGVIIASFNTS